MKVNSWYIVVFIAFAFLSINSSRATNYYISSTGNDSNSGISPEKAWKTLKRLNNLVPKPGDSILFRRGDSWNGTILVNMFGKEDAPVVYGAYGTGDKPKIYGSEVIEGWTKHSGNIYKTKLNKEINQLFFNDERMKVARDPDQGYHFISSTRSTHKFNSQDLNPEIDYTGAVWFGRTHYYTADLKNIIYSDSGNLTLNEAPRKELKDGLGFFLMNKLEFLNQPGEWCMDKTDNTLYFWPPSGESPENHIVRGSVYQNGIAINSKIHVVVRDLEFLQQAFAGIVFDKSSYLTFINNDFNNIEGYGIYSEGNSRKVGILCNRINGVNYYGIYARISYSIVSDNEVSNIALPENIGLTGTGDDNLGGGIYIAGEDGNNIIRYNRIENIGYNGILFAKPNNLIEYNFIKNIGLLKGDVGGIYTSWYKRNAPNGPQGSIIRHNIILNIVGEKYGYTSKRDFGEGIYVDESAKGVTVESNTIAHCTNSGIYLHQTEDCVVRYNTIVDTRQSIQIVKYSGTAKNTITDNILFAASDKDDYLKRQVFLNVSDGNSAFDRNHYINPYAAKGIFKSGSPYFDFKEWKSSSGQDKNSFINITPLASGEKEQLFYNDTKQKKVIDLGTKTYKDISGVKVTGKIALMPFTSKILIQEPERKIR